jgi:hypothetical protein
MEVKGQLQVPAVLLARKDASISGDSTPFRAGLAVVRRNLFAFAGN